MKYLLLIPLLLSCKTTVSDAKIFQEYSENWFKSVGLEKVNFECSMSGSTRAGHCLFNLSRQEFSILSEKLGLFEVDKLELKMSMNKKLDDYGNKFCGSFMNIESNTSSTDMKIYDAKNKPMPIFKGNSRSSFNRFWYSPGSEKGCLSLEYPYG